MSGGMQTSGIRNMYCPCGKPTSKIIILKNKTISIHFTKKSTYWHVKENGKTKRTFKKPPEWD